MNQYQTPPNYSLNANQQRKIQEATDTVIRLKESGVAKDAIYDVLISKGIEPAMAVQIIEGTVPGITPSGGPQARNAGVNDMIFGVLLIVLGLVLTIGSYMAVADSGGTYFITYGPIVYGIIRFFKGVAKMSSN